jgi:hypothetical protein
MVKRGEFDYGALTKIYCVAILANDILPYPRFHTVANLRDEQGELFDEQMTFITVELDKFTLREVECRTDLQKLIYTMKTIHTVTKPTQFPQFWDEEWLKVAIDELDSRKMTPDEKASLEMLIARNAEAVKAENRKINAAIEKEKLGTISNALSMGLSVEQTAKLANVSVDFVKAVQQKLSAR